MGIILDRIYSLFKAKTNSALDAMEQPIEMMEQAIRDLEDVRNQLVQAEASTIAAKRSIDDELAETIKKLTKKRGTAKFFKSKVEANQAEGREISPEDQDKLDDLVSDLQILVEDEKYYKQAAATAEANLATIQQQHKDKEREIKQYKQKLKMAKARKKTNDAMRRTAEQIAIPNGTEAAALAERMEDRMRTEEYEIAGLTAVADRTRPSRRTMGASTSDLNDLI